MKGREGKEKEGEKRTRQYTLKYSHATIIMVSSIISRYESARGGRRGGGFSIIFPIYFLYHILLNLKSILAPMSYFLTFLPLNYIWQKGECLFNIFHEIM